MDAFATYAQLGTLLNRVFTEDEQPWITALLESASTYLRDDVLGQQVYPQTQSTFTAWPDTARRIELPQSPVISVDSVQRDGVDVEYTRYDNTITIRYRHLDGWSVREAPVDISFTYGFTTPPDSLVRWTCVLVSQALLPIEAQLGLTAGGLSSVALDDFKAAFADAGDGTGITLTDRNIELLRAQFGNRGGYVVTAR